MQPDERSAERLMDEHLRRNGLFRKKIAKDGSCLFRAVAEQVLHCQALHAEVRAECVKYLREERHQYESFIEGDFEEYLQRLQDPQSWVGQVEISALAVLYRHDFIIHRQPGEAPVNITENGFHKKVELCFLNGNHYDSVYPISHAKNTAVCQSILYELLYDGVYGVERNVLAPSIRCPKGREEAIDVEQREGSDGSDLDEGEDFWFSETAGRGPGVAPRPPHRGRGRGRGGGRGCLLQKVQDSLNPTHFRNIEYDVWLRSKKAQQRRDFCIAAGMTYRTGDQCQVRLGNAARYYGAHIQEVAADDGPVTVFIEELGEKHTVPLWNLRPPSEESWSTVVDKNKKPAGSGFNGQTNERENRAGRKPSRTTSNTAAYPGNRLQPQHSWPSSGEAVGKNTSRRVDQDAAGICLSPAEKQEHVLLELLQKDEENFPSLEAAGGDAGRRVERKVPRKKADAEIRDAPQTPGKAMGSTDQDGGISAPKEGNPPSPSCVTPSAPSVSKTSKTPLTAKAAPAASIRTPSKPPVPTDSSETPPVTPPVSSQSTPSPPSLAHSLPPDLPPSTHSEGSGSPAPAAPPTDSVTAPPPGCSSPSVPSETPNPEPIPSPPPQNPSAPALAAPPDSAPVPLLTASLTEVTAPGHAPPTSQTPPTPVPDPPASAHPPPYPPTYPASTPTPSTPITSSYPPLSASTPPFTYHQAPRPYDPGLASAAGSVGATIPEYSAQHPITLEQLHQDPLYPGFPRNDNEEAVQTPPFSCQRSGKDLPSDTSVLRFFYNLGLKAYLYQLFPPFTYLAPLLHAYRSQPKAPPPPPAVSWQPDSRHMYPAPNSSPAIPHFELSSMTPPPVEVFSHHSLAAPPHSNVFAGIYAGPPAGPLLRYPAPPQHLPLPPHGGLEFMPTPLDRGHADAQGSLLGPAPWPGPHALGLNPGVLPPVAMEMPGCVPHPPTLMMSNGNRRDEGCAFIASPSPVDEWDPERMELDVDLTSGRSFYSQSYRSGRHIQDERGYKGRGLRGRRDYGGRGRQDGQSPFYRGGRSRGRGFSQFARGSGFPSVHFES